MTIDIDAIRKREQAATCGPWKTGDRFGNRSLGSSVVVLAGNLPPVELDPHRNGRNDAVFIAHARTDVPALCDEIERLRAELAKVREVVEAAKDVTKAYRAESGPFLVALARLDAAVSLAGHSCPNCAPGYDCERGLYTAAG